MMNSLRKLVHIKSIHFRFIHYDNLLEGDFSFPQHLKQIDCWSWKANKYGNFH